MILHSWGMRILILWLLAALAVRGAPVDPGIERQTRDTLEPMDQTEAARVFGLYASDSEEYRKGMRRVLLEDHFTNEPGPNHALFLLFHVLRTRPVVSGDTMPMALALAYNYYYAAGNEDVQKALRSDIIAHYDLYREIAAWQAVHARYAALDRMPVIVQVHWASRDRSGYDARTPDEVLFRLAAVKQIVRLHRVLAEEKTVGGKNAYELGQSIQAFYRSRKLPGANLTKEIRGYAAGPLLSFQERTGLFPTEGCVSDATNLSALLQAAGLAPLLYYQNFRSAGASGGINHEWPAVYDSESRRFVTVQRGNPWPSYSVRETPVDFEIFRPLWHHALVQKALQEDKTMTDTERAPPAHIGGKLRRNSYGERTTNGALRDFVFRGITIQELEELWDTPVWRRSPDGKLTSHPEP